MKRFLKTFLITFVICCSIVGVFLLLRDYLILNKIRKLQIDTWSKIENSNNFIYERFTINTKGIHSGTKLYYKDGISKQFYYDIPNKTNYNVIGTKKEDKKDLLYRVENAFLFVDEERFKEIVKHSILHFIKIKDNQYIISSYVNPKVTEYFYFDKETGMLEKWETIYSTDTYTITENMVTDDDVKNIENN